MSTITSHIVKIVLILCIFIPLSAFGQDDSNNNALLFSDLSLQPNQTGTLTLLLNNTDVVAAGQFRFTYDATIGFHVTGVRSTSRTGEFEVVFQRDDHDPQNVEVLVMFYSFRGATISPGYGAIFAFDYQTTAEVFSLGRSPLLFTEALLSDPGLNPVSASKQNGVVISDPEPEPTPAVPSVPEPSTLALVVAGLFGLGTFLWRKRKYSNPQ